jgi:methyl-accepting chemotaxis protein
MAIDERNTVIASACEEQVQVAREMDSNLVRIRDYPHNQRCVPFRPAGSATL